MSDHTNQRTSDGRFVAPVLTKKRLPTHSTSLRREAQLGNSDVYEDRRGEDRPLLPNNTASGQSDRPQRRFSLPRVDQGLHFLLRLYRTLTIIFGFTTILLLSIVIVVALDSEDTYYTEPSCYGESEHQPVKYSVPGAPFSVVCLGSGGGPLESDMSGFLVGVNSGTKLPNKYAAFDGGSMLGGLVKSDENGVFDDVTLPQFSTLSRAGYILKNMIPAIFIGHPHLDHVTGFAVTAPFGGPKRMFGLNGTLETLMSDVFNWRVWPNLSDRPSGGRPGTGSFRMFTMAPSRELEMQDVGIAVTALELTHGSIPPSPSMAVTPDGTAIASPRGDDDVNIYNSTAFLVRKLSSSSPTLLYLSDTGADLPQRSRRLAAVWAAAAPLVRSRRLRAIVLEVSYPSSQPDDQLFGHLTPCYLLQEMRSLATLVVPPTAASSFTPASSSSSLPTSGAGNAAASSPHSTALVTALQEVVVIVTHIKGGGAEGLGGVGNRLEVQGEFHQRSLSNGQGTCNELNDLVFKDIIFAEQGFRYNV